MKKENYKKKRTILASLLLVAVLCFSIGFAGCKDCGNTDNPVNPTPPPTPTPPAKTLTIQSVEEDKKELLYIGVEYDASTLIKKESGVKYEIETLTYTDESSNKVDIAFDGMKFIQKEFYDVALSVKGTKDDATGSISFNLKINGDKADGKLLSNTKSSVFAQNLVAEEKNVKKGIQSIECTYGKTEAISEDAKIANGGLVLVAENGIENLVSDFSAYDAENKTIACEGVRTYAGFYVKNLTYKVLKLNLNFVIVGANGTIVANGSEKLNSVENAFEIGDEIVTWQYYEVELSDLPKDIGKGASVKMALAATIADAEEGDVFYIDSFDIYHGSRKSDILDNYIINGINGLDERTRSVNMTQLINEDSENVKEGIESIKCVYGPNMSDPVSADISSDIEAYHIDNGGLLFLTENNFESVYDKFSAYDKVKNTYASDTEKTYGGFWVKNTTGKKLTVNFNLRLWGMIDGAAGNSVVRGVKSINSLEDGMIIAADDTEWHYYEVEFDNSKIPQPLNTAFPIIRMALAIQIEGAELGDTFYIDSFDIYHGSRA